MRRLLIRPGGIGDCLLSFPAMEYLRAEYTEVWVPSAVVPLVKFADRVCAISSTELSLAGLNGLPMSQSLAQRLRGFDHIVSWYGSTRKEFRLALRETGAACTFLRALPPEQLCCHATDYFCSQVGAPFGQAATLRIEKQASRRSIVIHPFSGSARKNWPLERYRELAVRLPLPVEWTAGPEEDLPGAIRFDNLAELADWMAGAALYIGNDSGITHLAAATGVKAHALFGPTDPNRWAPRGSNVRVIHSQSLERLNIEGIVRQAADWLTTPS